MSYHLFMDKKKKTWGEKPRDCLILFVPHLRPLSLSLFRYTQFAAPQSWLKGTISRKSWRIKGLGR
jgi:hypothetical protein